MFTRLEDIPKEEKKVVRQGDCQCACNSVSDDPDNPDGTIVAKDFAVNQIQVDVATGGG